MSKEGLVSSLITLTVVFDLCLLGFSGCVEREYNEDNYPMVVETESDVVDNQDVFEGEDSTEEEEISPLVVDTGVWFDQFTEDKCAQCPECCVDSSVMPDEPQVQDKGNPKYPPCHGVFATSCQNRCVYNGNCPCQCDKACTKAKDCCEDLAKFCPLVDPGPTDTDAGPSGAADDTADAADTAAGTPDTPGPSPDAQLSPDKCPKDCESWYDGCNTCQCKDGTIGGCTKMGCPTKAAPYCKQFKS
jgi:hypothetical protein